MKSTADCYLVQNRGEHGRFFLTEGYSKNPGERNGHYWCVLACHTAFGTVGYTWGSMGSPAAKFLGSLNKSYALGKLFGDKEQIFCVDEAVKQMKASLLDSRRQRDIDRDEAREAFDTLRYLDNEHEWHAAVMNNTIMYEKACDGGRFGMVINPQAEGFWEYLWPDFIKQLTHIEEPVTA